VAVGIRAARPTESEVIAEIHERTAHVAYAHVFPGQPFPRDETIRRWQSFEGQIVVAEQAGKIVGFAAFDSVELHALYVLPAYQDQGIGRLLLQAAGAVAQLWVSKENRAARRFYEMCGWSMDGDEVTLVYTSGTTYVGRVTQEGMEGTMGSEGCWSATRSR